MKTLSAGTQWRNAQILTKKNIQRGGGLGSKTAKATAREGNVSEMIDF